MSKFNFLYDHREGYLNYLKEKKAYLFKSPRKYSKLEKKRFELNSLYNVLSRLLEDIDLNERKTKLIYVVDSSEFFGYVDPYAKIRSYIFDLNPKPPREKLIDKKTKWRHYRYQVLFGIKKKETAQRETVLLHSDHEKEFLIYQLYLLHSMFEAKVPEKLLTVIEGLKEDNRSQEEKINSLINQIIDNQEYVDVFQEFFKKRRLLDRHHDLTTKGEFQKIDQFDWNTIVPNNKELVKQLQSISVDNHLYSFLSEPAISSLENEKRAETIKIDYRVLSYVCSVNELLKENDVNYRLALFSSSKLLNLHSKYLTDYLSELGDLNKEKSRYFKDVIYVRYPTFQTSEIKLTEDYLNQVESIEQELMPVIDGVLRNIKNADSKEKEKKIDEELSFIADYWEKLRDNFLIKENIEDVQELAEDEDEDEVDEIISKIEKLDFNEIYRILFGLDEQLNRELVKTYLDANVSRITENFTAQFGSIEMVTDKGTTRYFIKSLIPKTSQYVFQLPEELVTKKVFSHNEKDNCVSFNRDKLTELAQGDKYYLEEYIGILFSAILRDWKIVNSVSRAYINKYPNPTNKNEIYLLEEVKYFRHLSLRYELFSEINLRGLVNESEFLEKKMKKIDRFLEESIKVSIKNPRLPLAKISFKLEKLVIYDLLSSEDSKFRKVADDLFDELRKEFESNGYLNDLKDNFNRHCFKDNLYLMYYKIMLSFFAFTRFNNRVSGVSKDKASEYSLAVRKIINGLREDGVNGNNYASNFLITSVEQMINGEPGDSKLSNDYNGLPGRSFFRKFIAQGVRQYLIKFNTQNFK